MPKAVRSSGSGPRAEFTLLKPKTSTAAFCGSGCMAILVMVPTRGGEASSRVTPALPGHPGAKVLMAGGRNAVYTGRFELRSYF